MVGEVLLHINRYIIIYSLINATMIMVWITCSTLYIHLH